MVTAQNRTFDVGFFSAYAKWYKLTLYFLVSTACHVSSASPTLILSPSRGIAVNWSGKYSFFTAAWTTLSVSPFAAIGSRRSQR